MAAYKGQPSSNGSVRLTGPRPGRMPGTCRVFLGVAQAPSDPGWTGYTDPSTHDRWHAL